MSLWFRLVTGLFFCLSSFAAAQSADHLLAEKVLGPHWKEVARAAGMIFMGTMLNAQYQQPTPGHSFPTVRGKISVIHAIAGVRSGQIVTIHEWAGVWTSQRRMRTPTLFFFYAPSAAGLTSPVGGALGHVPLDSSGKTVAGWVSAPKGRSPTLARLRAAASTPSIVSVTQIEHAILRAREGN